MKVQRAEMGGNAVMDRPDLGHQCRRLRRRHLHPLYLAGTLTPGNYTLISAPAGYNYSFDTGTPGVLKLIVAKPMFDNVNVTGNALTLSGGNGTPNGYYYVQQSTNLTTWINLATNQFDANGGFSFTTNPPAGSPQSFYRLQLP